MGSQATDVGRKNPCSPRIGSRWWVKTLGTLRWQHTEWKWSPQAGEHLNQSQLLRPVTIRNAYKWIFFSPPFSTHFALCCLLCSACASAIRVLQLTVQKRQDAVLHGWALSCCCCCLTSLANLCSISRFFAFDSFRALSSLSLASVSFSCLSTQYSSFSSTFCNGTEWGLAGDKERQGKGLLLWHACSQDGGKNAIRSARPVFPSQPSLESITTLGVMITCWGPPWGQQHWTGYEGRLDWAFRGAWRMAMHWGLHLCTILVK